VWKILYIIKKVADLWKQIKIHPFVSFGLVGATNTIISYIVYLIVLFLLRKTILQFKYDYLGAFTVSFLLGVLWSYYWNNKITFREKKESSKRDSCWRRLIKIYIIYFMTGIVISNILLLFMVLFFKISEIYAPIINLFITTPINYILNKRWVFR